MRYPYGCGTKFPGFASGRFEKMMVGETLLVRYVYRKQSFSVKMPTMNRMCGWDFGKRPSSGRQPAHNFLPVFINEPWS